MTDKPSFARRVRAAKPRTLETNDRLIRRHILPAFGYLTVDAVTREQVQDWFASSSQRPGGANRAMPVLSMMMRTAELWGCRVHNTNPCKNTHHFKTAPKERYLTPDEIGRLNAVLTRNEFYCPQTVTIIRLLLLTGCRFGEIAALEWDWIKGKRIHLPDSKSGPHTVWLSSAARAVIDAVPRYRPECPYVFPGRPADRPTGDISNDWGHIRREAGLPGVRLHDLRHTWASIAAMNGIDMVTIAKHGEMDIDEARRRARDILARIQAGENPAEEAKRTKAALTVKALAEEYLRRCDPNWKPSGRKTVRNYLNARILPRFGRMRIDEIGPVEVAAWFDAASRDRPGAADRALEILRAMMFRAEEWGWRERDTNPCLGIDKNPRRKIARFLDMQELERLGRALFAHEDRWPEAVPAVRLLALTGCRRGEVLDLRCATSQPMRSTWATARPGRAGCPWVKPPGLFWTRCPATGTPMRSCSRDMLRAEVAKACAVAGTPFAKMPASVHYGFMTFDIPSPVMPSCRAKTCPWSAACSDTGGIEPRRATPILPTITSSRRRKRRGVSLPRR